MYATFSTNSPPELVVLPKGEMMNSAKYIGVLRDTAIPHMRLHNLHHLLADKAPCHTSQMSKRFVAVRINLISMIGQLLSILTKMQKLNQDFV